MKIVVIALTAVVTITACKLQKPANNESGAFSAPSDQRSKFDLTFAMGSPKRVVISAKIATIHESARKNSLKRSLSSNQTLTEHYTITLDFKPGLSGEVVANKSPVGTFTVKNELNGQLSQSKPMHLIDVERVFKEEGRFDYIARYADPTNSNQFTLHIEREPVLNSKHVNRVAVSLQDSQDLAKGSSEAVEVILNASTYEFYNPDSKKLLETLIRTDEYKIGRNKYSTSQLQKDAVYLMLKLIFENKVTGREFAADWMPNKKFVLDGPRIAEGIVNESKYTLKVLESFNADKAMEAMIERANAGDVSAQQKFLNLFFSNAALSEAIRKG